MPCPVVGAGCVNRTSAGGGHKVNKNSTVVSPGLLPHSSLLGGCHSDNTMEVWRCIQVACLYKVKMHINPPAEWFRPVKSHALCTGLTQLAPATVPITHVLAKAVPGPLSHSVISSGSVAVPGVCWWAVGGCSAMQPKGSPQLGVLCTGLEQIAMAKDWQRPGFVREA